MKNTKVIACVLSVAMLAGVFSGCSAKKVTSISTEEFETACKKTLKFKKFDFEDIDDYDEKDIEKGLYTTIDSDYIEEYGLEYYINAYLKAYDLDDIFEAEDIESAGVALKFTGMEDAYDIEDPEDLEELELEGGFALQLTLADDDMAADIMEFLADKLDYLDIDAKKDLTNKEFYSGKTDGYLKFHVDVAKLMEVVLDNDDVQDFIDDSDDGDEIQEALKALKGDAVVSLEVSGANVLVMVTFNLNTDPETINDFVKAFGVPSNPVKIPHNTKVVESVADGVATYIIKAREAAEQIRRHNEEIEEVQNVIDDTIFNDD